MDTDPSYQAKGQGRLPGDEGDAETWGLGVRQRVFQAGIGMCHVLDVRGGITETEWVTVAVICPRGMKKGSRERKAGDGQGGPVRAVRVQLSILGANGWEGRSKHTVFHFFPLF